MNNPEKKPHGTNLPSLTYRCSGCGKMCTATRDEIESERRLHDDEFMTDAEVVNLFAFCGPCAGA